MLFRVQEVLFVLCSLVVLCLSSTGENVMPYEPVEHLKAHLPKTSDEIGSKLVAFLKTPRQNLNRKLVQVEKNWNKLLKNEAHTSAILFLENVVLAKKLASQVKLNSTFLLPNGILLPIIATSLPILLEGYQPKLINEQLGSVLKEEHRTHRDVKDYLTFNLVEMVTKLPREGNSAFDCSNPELFPELERRGKAVLYFVNAVLGDAAREAWGDCMMSVSMDSSVFNENQQMLTSFGELNHYAETIANDLIDFYEVAKSNAFPLDSGHYLFGWWFNHPVGSESEAMTPLFPSDTVAILSHTIRVYSVPSLRLHLIIGNTGPVSQKYTLSEIIQQDEQIWNQMYSVVDPTFSQEQVKDERKTKEAEKELEDDVVSEKASKDTHTPLKEHGDDLKQEKHEKIQQPSTSTKFTKSVPAEEKEDEVIDEAEERPPMKDKPSKRTLHDSEWNTEDDVLGEKNEEMGTGLIHVIRYAWPIAVFLFYTILSHVWVYWILHLTWFVASLFSGNVHLPRPKTAKQD